MFAYYDNYNNNQNTNTTIHVLIIRMKILLIIVIQWTLFTKATLVSYALLNTCISNMLSKLTVQKKHVCF